MKIIIFGGSGLVGRALVSALLPTHQVAIVGRNVAKLHSIFDQTVSTYTWDQINETVLAEFDVAINLAGENIANKRWTRAQKQKIMDSRVVATTKLVTWCVALGERSPRLMNANAMSVYGLRQTSCDENSPLAESPTDFLSKVSIAWDRALLPAEEAGLSVVKLRFAVVLAKHGGALAKMLPSFKLGLGAVLGSGQQSFSWVALEDVVAAIMFLIEHSELNGPFNIVADEVVSQQQFAKQLAAALKRPCFIRMPSAMVKLLFGQMGEELLLSDQRIVASRLKASGFHFKYPTLESFLKKQFVTIQPVI